MLDLRLPIGLFFLIVGVILVASGFGADAVRAGLRVDLDWGVFLLVFGAIMTFFGVIGNRNQSDADEPGDSAAGAPNTPDHSARQGY